MRKSGRLPLVDPLIERRFDSGQAISYPFLSCRADFFREAEKSLRGLATNRIVVHLLVIGSESALPHKQGLQGYMVVNPQAVS